MPNDFSSLLSNVPTLAKSTVQSSTRIATLWSNYGSIDRVHLRGDSPPSIVVKTVKPPPLHSGEQADESHVRKLLSYKVERFFYSELSSRLPTTAKVAHYYPTTENQEEEDRPVQLFLEDLSIEHPIPARGSLDRENTLTVLSWLATFHGTFWNIHQDPDIKSRLVPPPLQFKGGNTAGVWEQGTYWYLDTRRDELDSTDVGEYKWLLNWVDKVDTTIKAEAAKYGTLLHGDVKGANTVFSHKDSATQGARSRCALYDFQYVGIGLVTRDLVKFLGTSVQSGLLRTLEQEKELLRAYHADLMQSVGLRPESRRLAQEMAITNIEYDFSDFWGHWELALVDWCRFMAGWGSWGNSSWVERRAKEIVSQWDKTGFPYSI
ncbi:hypothetical protein M408DRAFT_76999 [Serendipita vermifera MAFF 305830]|uniref:CHK kinase-like domain-containing protein n=1 Tax=Serendipita vermifera MAFF 305830 TaxID=933852 RepID=A0A0C3AUL5_SERVB|nr:hypothetical protein M408DRAFT_76999 [Serendipita vermifera MAFF 305830]